MNINREEFLNVLEQVKAGLSPREFIEQSSCLSADTIIHTLGGDFTIRQLLLNGDTSFPVFSTDGKHLRIGQATNLHLTRKDADVVQVLFDTGHAIKLTSDHLIMLRDGSYRAAGALHPGDSVMPFNRHSDGDYSWVYPNMHTGRERTHVWAFHQYHQRKAVLVHHKDGNIWNNLEDNLQEISRKEHSRQHTSPHPPMHQAGVAEKVSKAMVGNKNGYFAKGVSKPGLKGKPSNNPKGAPKGTGGTSEGAKRGWEKRRISGVIKSRPNHRVVAVVPAGKEDVYDLSVDVYHNFAANGIFVHNCFCFQDGMVMTFNDEVACRMKTGLDITGAIQANALLDILGKLADPELSVEENAQGELEFHGKKKRFGITKDAEIFLPIDRVEMPEKWHPLRKEFTEAVGLVQHCVSADESRFLLTCIHIHPEWIEACDNLQIMRVSLKTGLKNSVLVRGTSLRHIVLLGMDQVALTKSWIHFQNQAGLIFSCRRYSEDYPDLEKVMEVTGSPITIPKGLMEASDRAAVFAQDKSGDPLVSVALSVGVLRITGEGLSGWYKEAKKVVYDGPSMEFMIAPGLLKQISEKYQEAEIGGSKLKVSGPHWKYVTVLGKPQEAAEEPEEAAPEEAEVAAPKKRKAA